MSELPAPGTPEVLYLVDLSGYVFRAYHAIAPLSSSRGEPTHAVLGTVNMLQKVVNERRPSLLAVAMDTRARSFRHELDARYKATRPAAPPDLAQQMRRCEELVRAYRIPVFQGEGLEADDWIATLVARADADGLRVVIVSSDKDLMQLVHDDDDRVVLWDSMRDKVYGPAEVKEKMGVPPSLVRDWLALTGDTSDNVPGVPGVGPKTASDLLAQFGSVDGIYARIGEVARAKLRENLAAHEEDARLSRELVSLRRDAPVAWDRAALARPEPDEAELRRLFLELEFTRLLEALTPPAATERTYAAVTEQATLDGFLDEARARGTLAIATRTSAPDPLSGALLGIALAHTEGAGVYVPLGHRYLGVPAQLGWSAVRERLAPLLADPTVRKISHAWKRDALALERHGAPVRGPSFDTALAMYLLDPEAPSALKEVARRELGVTLPVVEEPKAKRGAPPIGFEGLAVEEATKAAAAEAEVPLALAGRLEERVERDGLGPLLRDVELPLARVLAEMERAGVLVDVPALETLGRGVEQDLRAIEAEAKKVAGVDFAMRSRDQLEKILFDDLKLPVLKRTPKGGRSTDAEVLEELAERHALPRLVCDFRELDKLKGTYIEALPRYVNKETGRIHTNYSQTTAATGRLSSLDPNLQNIPIRTELGRRIRACFVAPPGHVLVSADYSQIELRVLAHLAQDPELLDAFRTGEDVHTRTARLVFDVPREGVTAEMRRRAKAVNFGVIYGQGDGALAKSLGIPRDEAARFIDAYFARYAGVARFLERTIEEARKGEAVRTVLGRRRFLPNLHSANRGLRMEAERVAKNTPIQGTAADILKVAMVRLGAAPVVPGARMILTVHDELVFEVPEAAADGAAGPIREAMASAMALDVPLVVDVGRGRNWAEAH